jgi:peptidyl-prolyl cis-trans isomerase D
MVDEQVLLEANDKLGIDIPARRVQDEILKIPAFQNEGNFDAEQYRQVLASNGMSPLAFEERVRLDLGIRELPTQIRATSTATDA